ncbi:regulatory protein GemA [Maridesulfovibrio sp.]|uniref:gp16 family protein n=1 Tax=Maridesulfovibrio sp. TaxID=2795000 RepID=UPI0029CA65DC|nr:regulatory protein GemA [Maridesulfovibrio sp.]
MSIRNTLIAKVKIGCKQLDLTDDREAYEAMLHNLTGKISCSKMGIKELEKVIRHMESRGAVFTNKGNKRKHSKASKAQVRMVFGLWTELYELGGVDDPSRDALTAWVRRMTDNSCDDPDWLTPAQSQQLVESLKQWIARIS